MSQKRHFDYPLFFLSACLLGFAFLFLSILSAPASMQKFGNTSYYFMHQIIVGLIPGIVLGFIAYKISLQFLKKWAPLFVLCNIFLLFLAFLPVIGIKAGGASRWINLGFMSFQPSELLKITAIMYLAAWIASKLSEANVSDWKSITKKSYHNIIYILAPFLIFLGLIFIALYLQRDASTMGIITLTLLAMYFSARTPVWHTISIIVAGTSLLLFMVKFEPYRLNRWLIFLNPDTDPLGIGFQVKQSLISIGSGGILGEGLGMSTQKFGFLPQAMTDSIFAVIGEELGFLGSIAIIIVFILLFWMGLKISKNSNDRFSKIMAVGIVFWITFQAFINISSSAGIFPLAGIPLPFLSYGGTHLVVELIGIGLLLNISKNT